MRPPVLHLLPPPPLTRQLTMMSPLSRSAGSMVTHRRLPPVPWRSLRRSQQLWNVTTHAYKHATRRLRFVCLAVTDPCQVWGKETNPPPPKSLVQCELEATRGRQRHSLYARSVNQLHGLVDLQEGVVTWRGGGERGGEGQRRSGRHRRAAINVRGEECADCRPTPAGINQQIKNKQGLAWVEGDGDR